MFLFLVCATLVCICYLFVYTISQNCFYLGAAQRCVPLAYEKKRMKNKEKNYHCTLFPKIQMLTKQDRIM